MPQISIIGDEGKPVLYASLTLEGKLFLSLSITAVMKMKVITSSTTLLSLKSSPELQVDLV